MKRSLFAAMLFFISSLGVYAQEEMIFANEKQAFEIAYIHPWKLSDYIMDETAFAVYLPNARKNEPNETINLKTYRSPVNELATCAAATVDLLKERYSDLKIEKWEEVTLNAGKAYSFTYTFTTCKDDKCKKRIQIQAKSYILQKDFKVYFMTLTSYPKNFAKNESVFDSMAQTFHLVLRINI